MDISVCIGSVVDIPCGFVNDSANIVPNWRIIRSNNGSVISNMSISGSDILNNVNDGLEWIPDTTSGLLMSPNSRLVVGPVDETDNQSSYQCSFALPSGSVDSSVGTLAVTGMINMSEYEIRTKKCLVISQHMIRFVLTFTNNNQKSKELYYVTLYCYILASTLVWQVTAKSARNCQISGCYFMLCCLYVCNVTYLDIVTVIKFA